MTEDAQHGGGTIREEAQRRVYDKEVSAETHYRIEGDIAVARDREVPSLCRVDDIRDGEVALVSFSEAEHASAYSVLGPEAARTLAEALTAAAEYAEDQESQR